MGYTFKFKVGDIIKANGGELYFMVTRVYIQDDEVYKTYGAATYDVQPVYNPSKYPMPYLTNWSADQTEENYMVVG